MWILLGLIAIASTIVNLIMFKKGKDYKIAMAMGLSFTALSMVSEYTMVAKWVESGDISALLDVVPGSAKVFWLLIIISIVLNIMPLFLENRNK